jgi:hypothetical protein
MRYLLFVSSTETMRVHIALGSLLWGILLLTPGDTFDRPTYTYMAMIGPELAWAVAHLVHGGASMLSVLTGRRGFVVCVLDPVLGCVLWTSSAIAMLIAVYPLPAAIAPHLMGAAVSWWMLVRYLGEARCAD